MNESKKSWLKNIDVRSYTMIVGLIIIWIIFTLLTDGTFLSARNISNLTMQMAVVAILGTGMVLVIVTGHIDLSVGSLVGLVGGVAAALMVWNEWSTTTTILAVILLGLFAGALQGFATVYLQVPAFIVTLGGMMIFKGLLLGITKGVSIAPMNETYKIFGQAYVNNTITYLLGAIVILFFVSIYIKSYRQSKNMPHTQKKTLGNTLKLFLYLALIIMFIFTMISYKGMPVPVLIMLLGVIIFTFLAEKMKVGRNIYAIGGNEQAAKFSGINVKRTVLLVFTLNGFMAAIAGIILSARLNTGSPSAGMMLELDAIAAAVIGGTSLMGGVGKVYGAILGALIMASLDNGMSLLNIESFWQYIVKGSILILAVWFDVFTKKKK